jgi:hypothetical protein
MKTKANQPLGGGAWALFLLVGMSLGPAAMASTGTEGAAFLNIPVGAAPAAMGSAYSALANDAYAPVWNPAGLGNLDATSLAGQHLSYLESLNYEYASFVLPFANKHQGLGVSMQYLTTGDIAGTDNSGGSIGNYSSHFAAYALAYGRSFTDKFSLGLTGKLINEKISDVSANAYGGDLGTLYKITDKVTLAGVVANIGSKLTFLNEGDPLPLEFRAGAAYQPDSHWKMSAEGVYHKTGLASAQVGMQWRPLEVLMIRAGYKTDTLKQLSAVAGVTAGVGIKVFGQEIAYAFVPYGDLGSTQYFSIVMKFGSTEDEGKRNLIQYQTIKEHRSVRWTGGHSNNVEKTPSRQSTHVIEPEDSQLMQLLSESDKELVTQSKSTGSGAGQ